MTRNLDSATITELAKNTIKPILFVEIHFNSGPIYLWNGLRDFSWDSKTWLGTGALLHLNPPAEGTNLRPEGMEISLTGIDPAFISLALDEARQGRPVKCWLAFLDSNDAVIDFPAQFFNGRLDVMVITEGAESATVTVKAESRVIDFARAPYRRFTHEDQVIDYPSDLGFEYVLSIQEWSGQWGGGSVGDLDVDDFGNQRPPVPPPLELDGGGE